MTLPSTSLNLPRQARSQLHDPARLKPRLKTPMAWPLLAGAFTVAEAEGFRNPPPGTLGLGQAGAKTALVDDASAAWINPANLAALNQPEALAEFTLVHIQVDYESPTGTKSSTTDPFKFIPSLFASTPVPHTTNLVFAIGITSPYGLSNEWEQNGAFSTPTGNLGYTAPYFAELKSINAQPTLALKLTDTLQIGIGFDVLWSELTLKQNYPWFLLPGGVGTDPDGRVRVKGDGTGFGANLGFTWNPSEGHSLGLTYRSPVQVDYEGSVRLENMPARAAFFGVSENGPASTEIQFPSIVALGYGFRVNDRLRLGMEGEWIQFSNFESLDLNLGSTSILFPSTRIRQDWKDTFTAGMGGDYQLTEHWRLRASYQFYLSPVRDGAFSPTIPDADQQVFTVGASYKTGRHEFGLSYGGIFYADREITAAQNPAFNGRYEVGVHLGSASYRLRF